MSKVPASKLLLKAKLYEKKGELALAREAYQRVLNTYPNNQKAKQAIQQFRDGMLLLDRKDPPKEIMSRLVSLYNQRYFPDTLKLAQQLSKQYPHSFHVWNFLGVANHNLDRLDEAEQALSRAIEINPEAADICNNLANVFKDAGRNDEAIQLYERAIELSPTKAGYHRNLSMIRKFFPGDKYFERLHELSLMPGLKEKDKCEIKFALAKAYEDINEIENSCKCLLEGNAIRKKMLQYDIKQDELLFQNIKNTAGQVDKIELKLNTEGELVKPIFIIGMPRSGTSLVEQIITSHSDVTGAGELDYIARLATLLLTNQIQTTTENIIDIREKYLGALEQRSRGNRYITDKAPQNFRYLGLICNAFPDARIVHVVRDPSAVCWSNFKQHFTSDNLGYTCDLNDVVAYFRLYEDLMQFWSERYQEQIFTLDYEKLVTNQESETRKLIDYLGLGWDERCLEPEKNERSVRTASQEQVRKKVYSGSQQQWRKFEPFMNGAFDTLGS